jgi:ADP-heptose:LPS heptosyltransferase
MKDPNHLVVMRLSAMGDVAMMIPVFRGLCRAYPEIKITLVTRPFFYPLFSEFKQLELFPLDLDSRHHGFFGLWRLFIDLKKLEPYAFADLHDVLRSQIVRTFFKLSGTKTAKIDKGRKEKKELTRSENKVRRQLKHTVMRYADVFASLGKPCVPEIGHFDIQQIPDEIGPSFPQNRDRKWVGLAPFASFEGKTYPLNKMKEVCELLSQKYEILLFTAPGEETKRVQNWEDQEGHVFSMARLGSLEMELVAIQHLDLMISMDSANGHLAANYGVPVCSIWGLTHPYAGFAPFGQNEDSFILPDLEKYPAIPTSIYGNKVPSGYEKVMDTISPQQIVDQVDHMLTLKLRTRK